MAPLSVQVYIPVRSSCARIRDVLGITVHVTERICGLATAGQVLVSRQVVDLVAGSELVLESRGDHPLKGLAGSWTLFEATSTPRTEGEAAIPGRRTVRGGPLRKDSGSTYIQIGRPGPRVLGLHEVRTVAIDLRLQHISSGAPPVVL